MSETPEGPSESTPGDPWSGLTQVQRWSISVGCFSLACDEDGAREAAASMLAAAAASSDAVLALQQGMLMSPSCIKALLLCTPEVQGGGTFPVAWAAALGLSRGAGFAAEQAALQSLIAAQALGTALAGLPHALVQDGLPHACSALALQALVAALVLSVLQGGDSRGRQAAAAEQVATAVAALSGDCRALLATHLLSVSEALREAAELKGPWGNALSTAAGGPPSQHTLANAVRQAGRHLLQARLPALHPASSTLHPPKHFARDALAVMLSQGWRIDTPTPQSGAAGLTASSLASSPEMPHSLDTSASVPDEELLALAWAALQAPVRLGGGALAALQRVSGVASSHCVDMPRSARELYLLLLASTNAGHASFSLALPPLGSRPSPVTVQVGGGLSEHALSEWLCEAADMRTGQWCGVSTHCLQQVLVGTLALVTAVACTGAGAHQLPHLLLVTHVSACHLAWRHETGQALATAAIPVQARDAGTPSAAPPTPLQAALAPTVIGGSAARAEATAARRKRRLQQRARSMIGGKRLPPTSPEPQLAAASPPTPPPATPSAAPASPTPTYTASFATAEALACASFAMAWLHGCGNRLPEEALQQTLQAALGEAVPGAALLHGMLLLHQRVVGSTLPTATTLPVLLPSLVDAGGVALAPEAAEADAQLLPLPACAPCAAAAARHAFAACVQCLCCIVQAEASAALAAVETRNRVRAAAAQASYAHGRYKELLQSERREAVEAAAFALKQGTQGLAWTPQTVVVGTPTVDGLHNTDAPAAQAAQAPEETESDVLIAERGLLAGTLHATLGLAAAVLAAVAPGLTEEQAAAAVQGVSHSLAWEVWVDTLMRVQDVVTLRVLVAALAGLLAAVPGTGPVAAWLQQSLCLVCCHALPTALSPALPEQVGVLTSPEGTLSLVNTGVQGSLPSVVAALGLTMPGVPRPVQAADVPVWAHGVRGVRAPAETLINTQPRPGPANAWAVWEAAMPDLVLPHVASLTSTGQATCAAALEAAKCPPTTLQPALRTPMLGSASAAPVPETGDFAAVRQVLTALGRQGRGVTAARLVLALASAAVRLHAPAVWAAVTPRLEEAEDSDGADPSPGEPDGGGSDPDWQDAVQSPAKARRVLAASTSPRRSPGASGSGSDSDSESVGGDGRSWQGVSPAPDADTLPSEHPSLRIVSVASSSHLMLLLLDCVLDLASAGCPGKDAECGGLDEAIVAAVLGMHPRAPAVLSALALLSLGDLDSSLQDAPYIWEGVQHTAWQAPLPWCRLLALLLSGVQLLLLDGRVEWEAAQQHQLSVQASKALQLETKGGVQAAVRGVREAAVASLGASCPLARALPTLQRPPGISDAHPAGSWQELALQPTYSLGVDGTQAPVPGVLALQPVLDGGFLITHAASPPDLAVLQHCLPAPHVPAMPSRLPARLASGDPVPAAFAVRHGGIPRQLAGQGRVAHCGRWRHLLLWPGGGEGDRYQRLLRAGLGVQEDGLAEARAVCAGALAHAPTAGMGAGMWGMQLTCLGDVLVWLHGSAGAPAGGCE